MVNRELYYVHERLKKHSAHKISKLSNGGSLSFCKCGKIFWGARVPPEDMSPLWGDIAVARALIGLTNRAADIYEHLQCLRSLDKEGFIGCATSCDLDIAASWAYHMGLEPVEAQRKLKELIPDWPDLPVTSIANRKEKVYKGVRGAT